jgi:sodium-dependent phosphate cotransporter
VALGHIQRRKEFVLAFSGATVHDFFNICSVVVLLPLEVLFHPIEKMATLISSLFVGVGGSAFKSPLKMIVKPVAAGIRDIGEQLFHSKELLGALILILALVLLIFALAQMVKIMRGALAEKLEVLIDQYVFTSTLRALAFGMLVTAVVQSSSVTCSLMVPLLGVGIVKMEQIFPYVVGANIGTTVTALLASLVTGNPAALTIAFAHLVFNLLGMSIFLPLRKIPITLANWLGAATAKRRWVALVYVLFAFFVVPSVLILVF